MTISGCLYAPIISGKEYTKFRAKHSLEISQLKHWFYPMPATFEDWSDVFESNKIRNKYSKLAHRSLMVELVKNMAITHLNIEQVILQIYSKLRVTNNGLEDAWLEYFYTVKFNDKSFKLYEYHFLKSNVDKILADSGIKTPKVKLFKVGKYDIELADDCPVVVGYDDIELVG